MDEFPYDVIHEGRRATIHLKEKRLLTYNPDLAAKKKYEINRMVEKAKSLTMSGAKKNEYGDSGKYVSFTDGDGKKACVSINQKAIDNDLTFATGFVTVNETFVFVSDFLETLLQQNPLFFLFRKHLYGL